MKDPFDPQTALLDWYARYQRDLPWRREPTPYRVLVSELMLHQTQVDRVIPYFERFLERFPTIASLAEAPRAAVIDAWAGLGYNRRAVYLHQLARVVVERHGGELPGDLQALRALPGIGDYTAGALLSIGFGQDAVAIDTNVERVINRYAFNGLAGRAQLAERAGEMIPRGRAREWNQALMDVGATICSARAPRCLLCPLQPACTGAGQPPIRKSRRPVKPFRQTTRYYRGRMLAALRSLEAGQRATITELSHSLAGQGVAEPGIGWNTIGERLARDGLASIEAGIEGASASDPRIGLPR